MKVASFPILNNKWNEFKNNPNEESSNDRLRNL